MSEACVQETTHIHIHTKQPTYCIPKPQRNPDLGVLGHIKLVMVAQVYNSSTWEAEARG